jgi:hypothetical protein
MKTPEAAPQAQELPGESISPDMGVRYANMVQRIHNMMQNEQDYQPAPFHKVAMTPLPKLSKSLINSPQPPDDD